jgi:hypothetical protein
MLYLITRRAVAFPDLLKPGTVIVRSDQWNSMYFFLVFIGLGVLSAFYPYFSGIALYPLLIFGPILLGLARRKRPAGFRRADEVLASRPSDEGAQDERN